MYVSFQHCGLHVCLCISTSLRVPERITFTSIEQFQSSSLTARHLSPSKNASRLIYLVYLFRIIDCVKCPCSSLGRLRRYNFVKLHYIAADLVACGHTRYVKILKSQQPIIRRLLKQTAECCTAAAAAVAAAWRRSSVAAAAVCGRCWRVQI